MTSFSEMRKRNSDIDTLNDRIEKLNKKVEYSSNDERFWQPTVDKAGNGSATIRFLPESPKDGEEGKQFVRVWNHGFKGPSGQWYIKNCPTTINGKCPVCESNATLWNSGVEDDKKIVSIRKRKLVYISNILIINDPANPDNNGEVKLFKYGKKIFDMIQSKMTPAFPEDIPYNPFCMETGANFKLRARKFEGNRNYDLSFFDPQSSLFNGDLDRQEQLWNKEYSLLEFIQPSEFEDYDVLKKRLDFVLGSSDVVSFTQSAPSAFDDVPDYASPYKSEPAPSLSKQSFDMDDDDDFAHFKSLA